MTVYYLPLEDVASRYTAQLTKWMLSTFEEEGDRGDTVVINGSGAPEDIQSGSVLDACGRSVFAMSQCQELCRRIDKGEVRSGDVIFLQDFWTPGIEGVFYSLEVKGIKRVKVMAMVHAQTYDKHDFTYSMLDWMRPYETGMLEWIATHGGCLFVASSIHRDLIREAYITEEESAVTSVPIHVVGLPYNYKQVASEYSDLLHTNKIRGKIVFSSRLDPEKRPEALIAIAEGLIVSGRMDEMMLVVTSSRPRSALPSEVVAELDRLHLASDGQVVLKAGLSKREYYQELASARMQLNTALQDFVSWTLLEALTFGCTPVYPAYRSFPEILTEEYLYTNRKMPDELANYAVAHILKQLDSPIKSPSELPRDLLKLCSLGRRLEVEMALGKAPTGPEVTVWDFYNNPLGSLFLRGL